MGSYHSHMAGDDFQQTNDLGIVFFWIGFGFFVASAIGFLFSSFVATTEKVRSFSVSSCIIVSIAATAYFAMAMGEGYNVKSNTGRWNYWARYVDWAITTPLLLYDLALLAGASRPFIVAIIAFDELMILLGLFGSLSTEDGQTWGWYALGCVAFAPIYYFILYDFHKYERVEVKPAYFVQSWYLAIIWLIYPICWGLGTGAEVISNDAETVWFTILDIVAKAVYGSIILSVYRPALPFSEGLIADEDANAPLHASHSITAGPGGPVGYTNNAAYTTQQLPAGYVAPVEQTTTTTTVMT